MIYAEYNKNIEGKSKSEIAKLEEIRDQKLLQLIQKKFKICNNEGRLSNQIIDAHFL